jgi:hypothetical protein
LLLTKRHGLTESSVIQLSSGAGLEMSNVTDGYSILISGTPEIGYFPQPHPVTIERIETVIWLATCQNSGTLATARTWVCDA